VIAGRALAAVCDDRAVLARIGGSLGDAARAGSTADALENARAPVPPGLRGVDAGWIEAALAGLPARARIALAEGPRTEADVWLVRRAIAHVPPLPAIDPSLARPRVLADVARMSAIALRDWLIEVGRDHLAYALGDHAAKLAELAPALARIDQAPRAGALGTRRDAIARAVGEPFAIGVRALAPHLDLPLRRSVALRLPHPDALGIAAELTAHAGGRSGAWLALVAP
jgi:hypothetical protein